VLAYRQRREAAAEAAAAGGPLAEIGAGFPLAATDYADSPLTGRRSSVVTD
jgi:hypothetical protein